MASISQDPLLSPATGTQGRNAVGSRNAADLAVRDHLQRSRRHRKLSVLEQVRQRGGKAVQHRRLHGAAVPSALDLDGRVLRHYYVPAKQTFGSSDVTGGQPAQDRDESDTRLHVLFTADDLHVPRQGHGCLHLREEDVPRAADAVVDRELGY